jgi:pSer/pThr/pTyr-binding forkhead associated (FHA) protein
MQVVLVMFTGDGERRSFSVARDITVVGRREDCDLRIPVGDVSRKHCRLVKEGDTIRLEDLGSSNGSYVNGHRVQEAVLKPGDWIQIGPVQFVIQIDGEPSDEELVPPPSPLPSEEHAGLASGSDAEGSAVGEQALEEVNLEEVAVEETAPEEVALEEAPEGDKPADAEWNEIVEESTEENPAEANDVQIDLDESQHPETKE